MREVENNRMAAPDAAPRHKALASAAAARLRDMRIERIYGSTLIWWLVWIIWIPVFTPAITGLIEAHPSAPRLILSLAGALLFFALYLRLTWICAHDLASGSGPTRPSGAALWAPIVVMVALSLALTLWNGQDWGGMFIYTATCSAGWLPIREAAITVAALVALVIFGVSVHSGFAAAVSPATFVAIPGFRRDRVRALDDGEP